MKKIKEICFLIVITTSFCLNAQRQDLSGQLIANDDVEGIHILNTTGVKFTISNEDGSFIIPAKVSDTLTITGLKYEIKEVVITKSMVDLGSFSVQLTEKINELSEVVVGKILTGSLQSDLENSDAKTEINFYDLGIPGNIKKPLTQNERKLHDADAGSMLSLSGGTFGAGAGINFHKLLNKITGRTKKLRKIVELEYTGICISRLRREYAEAIFKTNTLAEDLKNEYFMFCEEDEAFKTFCEKGNDLETIEFLKQKLKAYKHNRLTSIKE